MPSEQYFPDNEGSFNDADVKELPRNSEIRYASLICGDVSFNFEVLGVRELKKEMLLCYGLRSEELIFRTSTALDRSFKLGGASLPIVGKVYYKIEREEPTVHGPISAGENLSIEGNFSVIGASAEFDEHGVKSATIGFQFGQLTPSLSVSGGGSVEVMATAPLKRKSKSLP
jgi:hypothetical protein